jgi:hypothetical protein
MTLKEEIQIKSGITIDEGIGTLIKSTANITSKSLNSVVDEVSKKAVEKVTKTRFGNSLVKEYETVKAEEDKKKAEKEAVRQNAKQAKEDIKTFFENNKVKQLNKFAELKPLLTTFKAKLDPLDVKAVSASGEKYAVGGLKRITISFSNKKTIDILFSGIGLLRTEVEKLKTVLSGFEIENSKI